MPLHCRTSFTAAVFRVSGSGPRLRVRPALTLRLGRVPRGEGGPEARPRFSGSGCDASVMRSASCSLLDKTAAKGLGRVGSESGRPVGTRGQGLPGCVLWVGTSRASSSIYFLSALDTNDNVGITSASRRTSPRDRGAGSRRLPLLDIATGGLSLSCSVRTQAVGLSRYTHQTRRPTDRRRSRPGRTSGDQPRGPN